MKRFRPAARYIALALILLVCGSAVVTGIYLRNEAVRMVDRSKTIIFHRQDTSAYDRYRVQNTAGGELVHERDFVLSFCTLDEYERIGDIDTYTYRYDADTLKDYIPNCAEITSISRINTILYVGYTTTSSEEVILGYDAEGFDNVVIYNPHYDRATFVQGDSITRYEHFREGSHSKTVDESPHEVNTCLQEDAFEKLLSMRKLRVTVDTNGAVWIAE